MTGKLFVRVPVVLFLLRCTCCAPTAAVIGAGEHGILAAVELQNRGYDVTVFEKEASAIPIANTVQLDGIYDYLSAAVLPSGNLNGSGTIKSLATLAFKYNQSLDFLPAGLVSNFRSFDSVEGVTVYPPTWKSLLGTEELLQQLGQGIQILERLEGFELTPAGVLQSGVVTHADQTYAEWAKNINLPAFTDFSSAYQNAFLSGPAQSALAAQKLNNDRNNVPGLLRATLLGLGVSPNSAIANATGLHALLQGNTTVQGLVYHFPAGLQALFAAIIQQESLNIQLNASVAKVTENGFVSLLNGTELQFDAVIVTIRPPAAAAVLPAGPATLYKNSITQACDVWIFNASFVRLTGLRDAQLVDDHPFAAFVTVNSTLGPPTGYPSYVVRLYENSPYIAAGATVEANLSQNSTTGMVKDVLNEYGFKVNSVVASRRIGYPSTSVPVPDTDKFGQIYLLGEALSGFGLTTATQYVPSRMSAWFGHV